MTTATIETNREILESALAELARTENFRNVERRFGVTIRGAERWHCSAGSFPTWEIRRGGQAILYRMGLDTPS